MYIVEPTHSYNHNNNSYLIYGSKYSILHNINNQQQANEYDSKY